MNIETPIYDLKEFPNVYEPSEDTFLFLDALEAEAPYLQNLEPKLVVEIGSGSGVVINALHQLLGCSCSYFTTDINPESCLATKYTSVLNRTAVECLNMNLLSSFKNNIFDVILFNPPYVVTDSNEMAGVGLNRSWAGGENGRTIIYRVIKELPKLLSKKGVCYMVLLKENKIMDILNLVTDFGFGSEMVIERKIPGEHLYVYKFFPILKINATK